MVTFFWMLLVILYILTSVIFWGRLSSLSKHHSSLPTSLWKLWEDTTLHATSNTVDYVWNPICKHGNTTRRLCIWLRWQWKVIVYLLTTFWQSLGKGKKVLSCLSGDTVLPDLLARFHLEWTDEECENFIMELIEEARGSWRTIVYDAYQLILNNIH